MFRCTRRDVGIFIVLTAVLAMVAYVPTAAAYSDSRGGTGVVPIDPQYGAGGGGGDGGGDDWSDPDEFGIYSRPATQDPGTRGIIGPVEKGNSIAPQKQGDRQMSVYLLLYRLFGGLAR